jgi:mitogen-activated protein kinase kinase kinase
VRLQTLLLTAANVAELTDDHYNRSTRNNAAPNGTASRYNSVDDDGDPDKHYFNRGLGGIDDIDSGNASAEDEDEYELSRRDPHQEARLAGTDRKLGEPSGAAVTKLLADAKASGHSNIRAPQGTSGLISSDPVEAAGGYGSDNEDGQHGTPLPHPRPQATYDVLNYAKARPHYGSRAGGSGTPSGGESESELEEEEEDNPEAEARFEWQHMLSNVLQGEVLKSEKTRISGTLTNDLDDLSSNKKWRAYQIWLRVRAYVQSRTVQQETDYIEEARGHIEAIWGEVAKFQVTEDDPQATRDIADSSSAEDLEVTQTKHADASEQIAMMVRKIEWCDTLYPSVKSLRTEKAHAAEEHIMNRIDALLSWQVITNRLKIQIGILQKWTGSEELEVTQPGLEAIDGVQTPVLNSDDPTKKPVHHLLDTSPFIERIFKEDTLQKTFEKSTIMDLYRLVHDAKSVMVSCRDQFTDMNLPTFYNDLIALINFPTNLIQEALKLRLNYVSHVSAEQQPPQILVDQLTIDFRSGLALAAKMKESFIEIMTPNVEKGWPGGQLSEEYDKVLLDSLRFFFKLLTWKLKSGSKAIYLKETEIVENEWKFLSEAVGQIEGGDMLVGEHFW